MKKNLWSADQYLKFRGPRLAPVFDLLEMVDRSFAMETALDLGCGTGEVSRILFDSLQLKQLLAIDSSKEMLGKSSEFRNRGMEFSLAEIEFLEPKEKVDLLFSNAALHWVKDHEKLFPRILEWVKIGGQVAIQMPNNHGHPSHYLANEVARKLFPKIFTTSEEVTGVLALERYAGILHRFGFLKQSCVEKIYVHPMNGGMDLVEWTKGSLLNGFKEKLTVKDFELFLEEYSRALLEVVGSGPFLYTFRRILLWGSKAV